jgi:DNA anti-recombination protein RmuC
MQQQLSQELQHLIQKMQPLTQQQQQQQQQLDQQQQLQMQPQQQLQFQRSGGALQSRWKQLEQ